MALLPGWPCGTIMIVSIGLACAGSVTSSPFRKACLLLSLFFLPICIPIIEHRIDEGWPRLMEFSWL